jgi:septal ring factor EnvC (AmiA/AmiB activator)
MHLTESDIVRAATAIAAQGEIPTIAAVRQQLHGRGSETTILNYLRKWKLRLLSFAVFCEAADVDPDFIIQMQQQHANVLRQLEMQREQNANLENQLANFRTENIVLVHGVKRLQDQLHKLQILIAQQQTKIECLNELNDALHTADALAAQKVLNQNLQQQLVGVREEIQQLLESA